MEGQHQPMQEGRGAGEGTDVPQLNFMYVYSPLLMSLSSSLVFLSIYMVDGSINVQYRQVLQLCNSDAPRPYPNSCRLNSRCLSSASSQDQQYYFQLLTNHFDSAAMIAGIATLVHLQNLFTI
ncbi:hypothetical protein Q3G72_025377 [Acer saccharum]|nr:hypothetical protein Q3G72_025377 [Acer saccharum]